MRTSTRRVRLGGIGCCLSAELQPSGPGMGLGVLALMTLKQENPKQ